MEHRNYTKEISGRGSVFFQSWMPSNKPFAILIVIHGFGEHSNRYGTHFADFYNQSNIGVFSFDLPGHGNSFGKKGHIAEPTILLEIIDNLIKQIKEDFPKIPLFLYGHSFGGEVALWYTLVRNPKVRGVIITSPLIGPKDGAPPLKLVLAKVMEKIMPSFSMNNGMNPQLLSRDTQIVDNYLNDPLVHDRISARSGMMVINRGKWILEHADENKNKILVMVGSEEGIVNKDAIYQFCKNAPFTTYKIWPGFYHELHNEPDKELVFSHSLEWITQNI